MIGVLDRLFLAIEQAVVWWLNTELPEQTLRTIERVLGYDCYELLLLIDKYIETIF